MRSRYEACMALGVGLNANDTEIKAAYKRLVKLYHPDSGNMGNIDRYNQVVEAYNFLSTNEVRVIGGASRKQDNGQRTATTRVMGNTGSSFYKDSNYSAFEKQIKKQKEAKKKRFEKEVQDYSDRMKRQDEEYKKAMAAIDAIRIAEALKVLIGQSDSDGDRNR